MDYNYDIVICDGTVIDGTGRPRFRANLGIRAGRIVTIATGEPLTGRETLDATGLIVAPGFVDMHSHSEETISHPEHDRILAPLVLQGITTFVGGNCGFSPAPLTDAAILSRAGARSKADQEQVLASFRWRSMGEFLDTLEDDGVLLNVAVLVGHGTLRGLVLGGRADVPAEEEVETMCDLARSALREGAFGLSVGLGFRPGIFARNEELLALLQVLAEEGGMWAVHGRTYGWFSPFYRPKILGMAHNRRDIRAHMSLARQAAVRLQISHLLFRGRRTWRTCRGVLRDIERASEDGQDIAFDVIPYHWGITDVNILFPMWFLDGFSEKIDDPCALRRLEREVLFSEWLGGRNFGDFVLFRGHSPELNELQGLDFLTIARALGMTPWEAYMHVARVSKGTALVHTSTYSGEEGGYDEPLRACLAHPLCSFILDTQLLPGEGVQHPAAFGGFPRVLGRYSRDLGLFSLEDAVRRMTSFPAERVGLTGVGRIAEGLWADLVLFDPLTVAENGTLHKPDIPPTGIRATLISGKVVAQDGQIVSQGRCGRVLRR